MSQHTTQLYRASLSLGDLTTEVAGDEAALGPLVALGHTSTSTAATFDLGPAPDDAVVIVDASSPGPDGKTKLFDGWVWVAGHGAQVSAYR